MAYTISDRRVADAATALIGAHGVEAARQAALLADASRDCGNLHKFCHWRQVGRMIRALSHATGEATFH